MTTPPDKIGPVGAPALYCPTAETALDPVPVAVRASLGAPPRLDRFAGLDPWLAAFAVADLFDRRFLWSSDCGRMRFAALGERRSVRFDDLGQATRAAAAEFDLPETLAAKLPLGLFVLGETDDRPGAFAYGESETRPICWTPQALLVAVGNDVLLYCADRGLRHELVPRLDLGAKSPAALIPGGRELELLETAVDSPETWRYRVAMALAGIRAGGLEKLVVSRRRTFGSCNSAFSPAASAWQAGLERGRTGFSISTDNGRSMFIGATPETLLKVQDGTLSTHALAGTRGRNASLEDFLASDKLAKEHTLVSHGLIERLGPLVDDIRPGPLRVRRSGLVSHLETPLAGQLRPGADALHILSDMHPTAAIGGLPQQEACQALQDIEPYSRGWFAAPFGWLAGNGDLHAAIAIRSLWISAERAVALAGAGIVRGSRAEEEWAETESKFDNMRAVIRGESLGR